MTLSEFGKSSGLAHNLSLTFVSSTIAVSRRKDYLHTTACIISVPRVIGLGIKQVEEEKIPHVEEYGSHTAISATSHGH